MEYFSDMSIKITKRPIGRQDIAFDVTGTGESFLFAGSDGVKHRADKLNASHIPLTQELRNVISGTNVEEALLLLFDQIARDNQATEIVAGVARIATTAEVAEGLSDELIVTPKKLLKLLASATGYGLVKLATASDIQNGTNPDSVLTVGQVSSIAGGLPAGFGPLPWYFDAPPVGFVKADGSEYSRALYADLWQAARGNAVDDETWQEQKSFFSTGDGATTFRVPDLRGMFLRGYDNAMQVDKDAESRVGGNVVGSYQADEFKKHNHGGGIGVYNLDNQVSYGQGGGHLHNKNGIEENGGTETRPKNVAVHWLFKV